MKFKSLTPLLLLLATTSGADTVKTKVGHLCCPSCTNAATGAVKQLAWVESASAEGANLTVVSKSGQSADVVSLLTTLRKAGFPAMELIVTGPLTITMPHLCCPSCTNDLKAKLEGLRSMALDKENIKIDQAARTVTLQPRAGGRLNLVQVLTQLERAGWSAEKITIAAQTASTNDASRNAN